MPRASRLPRPARCLTGQQERALGRGAAPGRSTDVRLRPRRAPPRAVHRPGVEQQASVRPLTVVGQNVVASRARWPDAHSTACQRSWPGTATKVIVKLARSASMKLAIIITVPALLPSRSGEGPGGTAAAALERRGCCRVRRPGDAQGHERSSRRRLVRCRRGPCAAGASSQNRNELPNGRCSGEAVGGLEDAAGQLDGCVRGGERVLAVDEDGR